MLTRKSLVRTACRGERPIERASGWFPPKFLLGKRLPRRRLETICTCTKRREWVSDLHAALKQELSKVGQLVGMVPGKQALQGGSNHTDAKSA